MDTISVKFVFIYQTLDICANVWDERDFKNMYLSSAKIQDWTSGSLGKPLQTEFSKTVSD